MSNISVNSSIAIASVKSGLPVPEEGSEIVIRQAFEPCPSRIRSKSPLPVSKCSMTWIGPRLDSDNVSICGRPFSRISE